MARLIALFLLCLLPALVSAIEVVKPFYVEGRVYCDTCRAGYETDATPGIAGAIVKIECCDRDSMQPKYSIQGMTDEVGKYRITVPGDHGDDLCEIMLVSSPRSDCCEADPGRSRSRLTLTRNNGVISDTCPANAMGFFRNEPMSGCLQLLQKYQEPDE